MPEETKLVEVEEEEIDEETDFDDDDEPEGLTDEELDELTGETDDEEEPSEPEPPEQKFDEKYRLKVQTAFYHWHSHGYPEKAAVLYECIQQKRLAPSNLLMLGTEIQPQTSIDPTFLEIPPRSGSQATHAVWREFAKKVIDMDHMIIDTLQRKDIIEILEANKVIPKEEPEGKTKGRSKGQSSKRK